MPSTTLGLSLTQRDLNVPYLRRTPIQDSNGSVKIVESVGNPLLETWGGALEFRHPWWTSDDRHLTVHSTALGGFGTGKDFQSGFWGASLGAAFNFPNYPSSVSANVGYAGWTITDHPVSSAVLLGVDATLKIPWFPQLNFTLGYQWHLHPDHSEYLALVGVNYMLSEPTLPPLLLDKDHLAFLKKEKVDIHTGLDRAGATLAGIKKLKGYPLQQRIDDLLKENRVNPALHLEEKIKAVAAYLTWVRNVYVVETTLNLDSLTSDLGLVDAVLKNAAMTVDISSPPFDKPVGELQLARDDLDHNLAQIGLEMISKPEDGLLQQVRRVGEAARGKINASLTDEAKLQVAQYSDLLDLLLKALSPTTTATTPPALNAKLSPQQRELVEGLVVRIKCLQKGEKCKPVDESLTVPRLTADIDGLMNKPNKPK